MSAELDAGPQGIVARFVGLDGKEKECMLPHDARNGINHVRNRREGKRVGFAYGAGATRFGLHGAPTAAGGAAPHDPVERNSAIPGRTLPPPSPITVV